MDKRQFLALGVYLLAINLIAALLTISDKRRSINHQFRISEKALFLAALLGGSVGEYCTMRIIRHKTLHKRFMWGLPAIIVLQITLAVWLFIRLRYTG